MCTVSTQNNITQISTKKMVLTDRQKSDLHEAIVEYFIDEGDRFKKTIELFKIEAEITNDHIKSITTNNKKILEKKWTSVIRLQKKIIELEAQIVLLQSGRYNNISSGSTISDLTMLPSNISNGSSLMTEVRLPRAPAKSSLTGHRGGITSISIHPKYSILASASEDTTIKLWDFETSQYERTLKGHTGSVTGVAFDHSGDLLASCSIDMTAKIWDTSTYTCIKTLKGHDHSVSSVKFSTNNLHLLSCSRDQTIKCWDVSSGFCTRTYSGHTDWVRCISLSLDGEIIASGSSDQSIIIWNFHNGSITQTLKGHEHVVECLSFGKKPFNVADLMKTKDDNNSNNDSNGNSNGYSNQDYSYLVSGSRDKTVKLWDPLIGLLLMTFNFHENWVKSVGFHPNGKYIISVSDDKSIKVIDVKQSSCVKTIAGAHEHFINTIAISSIRPIIATGSVDKKISIWEY